MNFKYVETITEQNIKLSGCLTANNNSKCIMYIPGLSGNFFETKYTRLLAQTLINNGYDFLFAHNQGSFQVFEVPFLNKEGKWKSRLRGAAYEKFEDCLYDIGAWIDYLKNLNYNEVTVVAHSMGCNKIVYYLNNYNSSIIKKLILLAPQDNINYNELECHKGLLEEAKNNIKSGFHDKLLSKKFLGFCLMSSETYYNEITNQTINNIPYKTSNGNFSLLNNINIPIHIIIGSEDIGNNGEEYMTLLMKHCKNGSYDILNGANHNFKNKEEELSELILKKCS